MLAKLGQFYHDIGQTDQAITHYEQALTISQQVGNRDNEGSTLNNLGKAYRDLGQIDRVRQYFEQALVIFEVIKSPEAETARQHLAALDTT